MLGGLLSAAAIVGIMAFGVAGNGRSTTPPAAPAQSTSATTGSAATPDVAESARPEGAGSTPDTPELAGTWIAVLDSIAQEDGGLDRARSIATNLDQQYGVAIYVIDSGHYQGLNPGWWAVVMIGFDTNEEARAACSWVGRTPSGSCYGRRVKG